MLKIVENKNLFFLIFILAIAAFFRLWQLDSIPPGLYPDVAMNGNDALETLKTGNFKVFYPENNGREGLMIWLIAASFSIFGASIWSIKIVAAVIGILTILGLYLLTQEIFKNTKYQIQNTKYVALLSSFFLATSFWHTNFSRIGFRAILLPFVLVFAFYFLFKGFNTQRIRSFLVAGLFFGLGFYTYTSYRLIVLLIPLILICWWYLRENKKLLISTISFLLVAFFVALPIFIYFLQNPQDFISRATPISVFSAENPIRELGKSLVLHLGMFNFYGDPNWRHNFAGAPMFPWPLGILFLIGIVFSIKELIYSVGFKNHSQFSIYIFLISWFFVMLLPGILTHEGIPHALRVVGVIPVVYIFTGLGSWWFYEKLKPIVKNQKILLTVCLLFILFVAGSEFNKYFFTWAKNPNVKGAFTERYAEIGYYLNSLPPQTQKYVIVNEPGVPVPWPNGLPMPAQTPMFIENIWYWNPHIIIVKEPTIYLLPQDLNQIKIEKTTIIVPMKYDENLFDELMQKFPQGQIKKINGISIYETPLEISE